MSRHGVATGPGARLEGAEWRIWTQGAGIWDDGEQTVSEWGGREGHFGRWDGPERFAGCVSLVGNLPQLEYLTVILGTYLGTLICFPVLSATGGNIWNIPNIPNISMS